MKKHLALVLALVMVLTSFSFVSAAPDFSDMEGHVNAEAVARLELLNVLKGYPDGTFKPNDTITRAEFAAVAVRVSGLENVAMAAKGLPTGFTDVPAHHWASGYVGTAAKMGIVVGIGNGLFAPESPVKYEEAITMVVRALGYEPMAQSRGGYPFGYLIVANELDLLDGAMGTQGTWATRGFVAQITDNALEIPMMIQVGFGTNAEWVVSGEQDTDEVFLLDRMGFEVVEGVVEVQDVADMEIEIGGDDYIAPAGFDFFITEGAEIKAWVDGDDVIAYSINDDVYIGAFDYDDYDFARNAVMTLNGVDAEDIEAEFAKFVENSDGDVSYVEAFKFDGFILVEEIDDEMILDMNDDEVDVEDFVILKNGETVSIDELEEGDLVFFYNDEVLNGEYEGLAVAYNESEVGEIDRVYSDSFRMDGTIYDLLGGALYLDETGLGEISNDLAELEMMMDEETEVEVFLNFEGDVALVVGDTGEGQTSTFYAVLTDDTNVYPSRSGNVLAVDVLNEFGEEVSYDLSIEDLEDDDIENNIADLTTTAAIEAGELVELEVDEDGDVVAIEVLTAKLLVLSTPFEIDDTYADIADRDSRLMSNTVIFYDGNDEVIALGDVDGEFSEVETGTAYVLNGRVEVVLAATTDADTDDTDYTGLVTRVRTLRSKEVEVTIDVAGEEMVFVSADENPTPVAVEDEIWTLTVGDTSGEIDAMVKTDTETFMNIHSVDVRDQTINVTTSRAIELTSDAMIYDVNDDYAELGLRDISAGDDIEIVFAGTSQYWVDYVLVTPSTSGDSGDLDNVYLDDAYQLGSEGGQLYVVLDGVTYMYGGSQTLSQLEALESDTVPVIATMVGDIVTEIVADAS